MTPRQIDTVYDELIKEGKGGEHIRDYVGYAMDRAEGMILDVVIPMLMAGSDCPCVIDGDRRFCNNKCPGEYSQEQEKKCWKILINKKLKEGV